MPDQQPQQQPRKPTLLFVDDDARLLDGLRRALRRHRNEWDMTFVGSGWEALRFLEDHPVDVVVTDMRMPEMDGAELLACVRDRQPDAIRFVLSGYSSRDAAFRAAHLTHQFLPKPIEMAVFDRVLARALALREIVDDAGLRAVVNDVDALPSPPGLYMELMRSMGDDDLTVPRLTRLVERDTALCAKVLHVANSAFFGLPRATSSVERAISYLGIEVVRALVLTTDLYRDVRGRKGPDGLDLAAEQAHALSVAVMARGIAGTTTGLDAAFTAGLLHDVGKLVVGACPEHPAVGAYLVGLWGLPQQVVEAVAYHHAPGAAPQPALDAVAAVHIANALIRERDADGDADAVDGAGPSNVLDEGYVTLIGADDRIAGWRCVAASLVPEAGAPDRAAGGDPNRPA